MRRRAFIILAGQAMVIRPLAALAQPVPVVGLLRSTPAASSAHLVDAFRQGLAGGGYVDGQNVAIEQRWADNQLARLPGLAEDLIRRGVSVIVGNRPAVLAAKSASSTIPIVFVLGDDPVKSGLVRSLSRPGGNITGITFFGGAHLNAKRLSLLRDVVPKVGTVAILVDITYTTVAKEMPELEAAAGVLGLRLVPIGVAGESDFVEAFARAAEAKAGAMLVSGGPLFTSNRQQIVALAAKHAIPTIYDLREFAEAGGLISYSASIKDAYRRAGTYASRILKGDKASELPVEQASQIDLVINLKTAKALGIALPLSLQTAADEVIE
jgi:putative ABC transport system substrate-binding protein